MRLSPASVHAAAAAIRGQVLTTPLVPAPALSKRAGCTLYLKLECLQPTGSFKVRGALNRLLALTRAERRRGVVALSAGNHAQAVAHFAALLDIPATIVMPETAPFTKVERTQACGARVLQHGQTLQDGRALVARLARRDGLTPIHPYDDAAVVAGQGTIAQELLDAEPGLDAIVVPVGGGGLISGIAVAAKAIAPRLRIVGVQAERFPALYAAFHGRQPSGGGITLADGIAVKRPGRIAGRTIPRLVDAMHLVSEAAIEQAVALLAEESRLVVEGAGAAALAAVLQAPARFRGRRVALIVSGGNIDSRLLATVLLRALVHSGRLIRLRVGLADIPGALSRVAALIGAAGGNIVEIAHQRMFHAVPPRQAEVDVIVETRDDAHARAIAAGLREAGYPARRLPETGPAPKRAHH